MTTLLWVFRLLGVVGFLLAVVALVIAVRARRMREGRPATITGSSTGLQVGDGNTQHNSL